MEHVRLLEHVVVVFDLYKDREKLQCMYKYMCTYVSFKVINPLFTTLEVWILTLFRFNVYDAINEI